MFRGSGRRASGVCVIGVAGVVGVAGLGLSAGAQPAFSVTRVAQTGDAVADDPGATISGISEGTPTVEAGVLVFDADTVGGSGSGGSGASRLFRASAGGTITTLVSEGTASPGGYVYGPALGAILAGGEVTWRDVSNGAFVRLPLGADPLATEPTLVVEAGVTPIPRQPGEVFSASFDEHGFDGNAVLFEGRNSSGDEGMYRRQGSFINRIVDRNTPTPFVGGTGTIAGVDDPFIRDGQMAFLAGDTSSARGILADFDDGLGLRPIAQAGDPMPGGTGSFNAFNEVSIEGDFAVFGGRRTSPNFDANVYLYQNSTGTLTAIADETVQVPGEGTNFAGFEGNPSIAGGHVLFEATNTPLSVSGLFLYSIADGSLTAVVRVDDTFDGRVVSDFGTRGPAAGLGNQFGFRLEFDNGDEALYIIEIDEDCPADTNGDGLVTPADFTAWILAFNSQAAACDQNGDGLCQPNDFSSFILNYNAGC
ncbi:MAG: GC-type dockerin domain-anchored protein [Planctomycetota bacterium]